MLLRPIRDIFRSFAQFDAEGRHVNGTDKESNHHYGDAYEEILSVAEMYDYGGSLPGCRPRSIRKDVKLMMEVGVADGSSLLAWREVFPNATIVGMDIHHADRAHGERIDFWLGNQCSREDCERVAAGRQFDLIVEDATHEIENTLLTLYWLWPFVRPGGLYIVEEWENVDRDRIMTLWPNAEIVPVNDPEPLVVFRKSL